MYTLILSEKLLEEYKELAKGYGYSLEEFIDVCINRYVWENPRHIEQVKPINNSLSGMAGWSR